MSRVNCNGAAVGASGEVLRDFDRSSLQRRGVSWLVFVGEFLSMGICIAWCTLGPQISGISIWRIFG